MSSLAADGDSTDAGSGSFLLPVNFVFLSTVMAYGLGFLAVILITRELGGEGRGVTVIYQSTINLVFVFLSLGIGNACIYFVSKGDITAREALEAGLTMTLLATALVGLGLLLTSLLFLDGLVYDGVPYWLALVAVPGLVQFQVLECVLRGQGRFGAMNVLNLALPLWVLLSFLVVELAVGLTVLRAVYAWSFAFVPPVLLGYVLVGTSAWPRALMTASRLKPLLVFGAQGQAGNLVQLLNYRLDVYIILILTSTAGVGFYATGIALSEGLWFIANSVAVVLLTNLSANDEAYRLRMTPLVCRGTLLITALAALATAIAAPVVIPLIFGSEFEKSVLPFLFLLPGTVALAGGKILSTYVFSRGKPSINTMIAVATLVVTLAADVLLIPPLGVPGAAIASSIAYGVSLALTALAYRHLSGGSIMEALIPRPSDLGLALEAVRGVRSRLAAR